MSTGKRFRISKATFCIESLDDKRMIGVQWKKHTLSMFAEDLRERGVEITGGNGE